MVQLKVVKKVVLLPGVHFFPPLGSGLQAMRPFSTSGTRAHSSADDATADPTAVTSSSASLVIPEGASGDGKQFLLPPFPFGRWNSNKIKIIFNCVYTKELHNQLEKG